MYPVDRSLPSPVRDIVSQPTASGQHGLLQDNPAEEGISKTGSETSPKAFSATVHIEPVPERFTESPSSQQQISMSTGEIGISSKLTSSMATVSEPAHSTYRQVSTLVEVSALPSLNTNLGKKQKSYRCPDSIVHQQNLKKQTAKRLRNKQTSQENQEGVLLKLVNTAQKQSDEGNYNEGSRLLDIVFDKLKTSPNKTVKAKAERALAFSAGKQSRYADALKYFESYKRTATSVNPSDILVFSGCYLGYHLFATKHDTSRLNPTFDPEKGKELIFSSIRTTKAQWIQFQAYRPEYHHYIQHVMILMDQRTWTIEKFKTFPAETDDLLIFRDMLAIITAQTLLERSLFKELDEVLDYLEDEFYVVKNYFYARSAEKQKNYVNAYDLYYKQMKKNNPVFKDFAQMLLNLNEIETAAIVYLYAAEYYTKQSYHSEAAFYTIKAELLFEELNAKDTPPSLQQEITDKPAQKEASETETSSKPEVKTATSVVTEKTSLAELQAVTLEQKKSGSKLDTSLKPPIKIKQTKGILSCEQFYYTIREMIKSMEDEDTITNEINQSLKYYPDDLWLLHTGGWWHYEQKNLEEAKRMLLRGLQLSFKQAPNWRIPTNNHEEKQLLRIILRGIDTFWKSYQPALREDDRSRARDIASFLSAYAHILVLENRVESSSRLRQWADRLDTRRNYKARLKQIFQDQRIRLVSQEEFNCLQLWQQ